MCQRSSYIFYSCVATIKAYQFEVTFRLSAESAKKYGLTAGVVNKLGFNISRMLAKTAVYRGAEKDATATCKLV